MVEHSCNFSCDSFSFVAKALYDYAQKGIWCNRSISFDNKTIFIFLSFDFYKKNNRANFLWMNWLVCFVFKRDPYSVMLCTPICRKMVTWKKTSPGKKMQRQTTVVNRINKTNRIFFLLYSNIINVPFASPTINSDSQQQQ